MKFYLSLEFTSLELCELKITIDRRLRELDDKRNSLKQPARSQQRITETIDRLREVSRKFNNAPKTGGAL